jgi:MraZ protein
LHFLSTWEHSIDAKNRLQLPAEVRDIVDTHDHGTRWVAGPGPHGLLKLWPQKTFDRMLEPYSKDPLANPGIDAWRTMMYRRSAWLEVDGAGRIRLPDRLLKDFGLTASVVLLGAGDGLELMDAERYRQQEAFSAEQSQATWQAARAARPPEAGMN